ncbi:4-hydroxyphenylpyruvate 3-dimethylallyltransferase [Cladobotryum mycophilum]|uniref:Aromatic prenyltransferase n=1 Tax=Cladobotryum mycophilum TaxID=491253 RepID=A0ABR0S901_9HYPO
MTQSFCPDTFLKDTADLCSSFEAPYSELVTRTVLQTFASSFQGGAVLWRITNFKEDGLNYRFYERASVDLIRPALEAGLLSSSHPLLPLIASWSALYPESQQSCDFDTESGLTKTWIYLGGMRPLGQVLASQHVPETLKQLQPAFRFLELNLVRHIAIDWRSSTVNLYFRVEGALSHAKACDLMLLARASPPTEKQVAEIRQFMHPSGFTFSVTISVTTGRVQRVGFYALRLPRGELPDVGQRLERFFKTAKSYDMEEMNAVAWSFGETRSYLKAERSYCGNLVELMKGWKSILVAE